MQCQETTNYISILLFECNLLIIRLLYSKFYLAINVEIGYKEVLDKGCLINNAIDEVQLF